MSERMPLLSPIKVGKLTASNRVAINAMECCDADTGGNPTETAFRRYERLARGDAGMIVVEALSVVDELVGQIIAPRIRNRPCSCPPLQPSPLPA